MSRPADRLIDVSSATNRPPPMPQLHRTAFLSPSAWARFALTAIVGLFLDQFTKIAAFARLVTRHSVDEQGRAVVESRTFEFIPDWLHFDAVANPGAVFGIGPGRRALFIAVSVAAILFIFYLFATSGRQRGYQVVLGMLLAGVIGNLYDRVTFGYVRDMIHVLPRWGLFPWVFNVADSLLCVGVGLMIVHSLFQSPAHPEEQPAAPT